MESQFDQDNMTLHEATTFSIDDFPTEILERFAPDQRPKTISTLKLVNKRFYFVFSNDRFFKSYLLYPEENYLCEMKSECKAHRVKDVVDDINYGKVGRWKGYLKLEKIHADNLSRGRFDTFDELPLPRHVKLNNEYNEISEIVIDDLIDDNNEHWLLCSVLSSASAIMLFNVTAKPKLVHTITDSLNYAFSASLLPGQVMVQHNLTKGRYDIHSIVMDGKCHILTHQYVFEDLANKRDFDSGLHDSVVHGRYYEIITCKRDVPTGNARSVFIGYNHKDMLLSIWDLKSGLKMGKVVMSEYTVWQKFLLDHADVGLQLNVFAGEFPNVTVCLGGTQVVQTTLFDVIKMEVTHLVDEVEYFTTGHIFSSTRSFIHSNYMLFQFNGTLNLYLLETPHNETHVHSKCGRLLRRFENMWVESDVLITRYKAIFRYISLSGNRYIKVLTLDGAEVYEHSVLEMDREMRFINFVFPNLMVMFEPVTSKTTVFDIDCQRTVSIENLNPVTRVGGKKSCLPSKMVFATQDYTSLRLYHF